MRQVKHGIVGLGWFGEKHCEAFSSLPHVEIASLCTRTESRLSELGDRFGIAEEKRYTDYGEMFADPDVESVSITTMWDQHVDPTVAALEAGKHVFLEKPMASTVADCDAIVEAAAKAKGHLLVGHICRFNPRYAAARDAIASGRMEKLCSGFAPARRLERSPDTISREHSRICSVAGPPAIPTSSRSCRVARIRFAME